MIGISLGVAKEREGKKIITKSSFIYHKFFVYHRNNHLSVVCWNVCNWDLFLMAQWLKKKKCWFCPQFIFIHWSALKHDCSISFWSWPQMLLYATCKWLILSKYIPCPHKNSPYLNGRVKCQKVHIRKAASKTDQKITAVRGRGMERMSQPIFTSRSTYRVTSVSTIMMSPHKMSRS